MTLVVRSSVKPEDEVNAIRAQIWQVDKDQPLSNVATLDQYLSESVAIPRLSSEVVGGFSLAALTICLVGLHGVVAYSVSQRKHRNWFAHCTRSKPCKCFSNGFGRRRGHGYRRDCIRTARSADGNSPDKSLLFRVHPIDIATFITVTVLLAVVAFLASLAPARNALKVDPMVALRYE